MVAESYKALIAITIKLRGKPMEHYTDGRHWNDETKAWELDEPQEVGLSRSNALLSGWHPINTAPKDGTHIQLYKPEIQFVGYWAIGCGKWIINAPDLPKMEPGPTQWKYLDWPNDR